MKTTRDSLLVVFVSFIAIVQLARCGASTILDDRDKETEEIEKLVRKEVITSLQLLSEEDDDVDPQTFDNGQYGSSYAKRAGNGTPIPGRYYQLSNQNFSNGPEVSENSYKTPKYSSYYDGNLKPANGNGVQISRSDGNSNSPMNFRYSAPSQQVRGNENLNGVSSNDARSIPFSSASTMNTREPGEYTTTVTLPSLGIGRLLYGGSGSGGGGGYSGSGGYGGGIGYSGGGGGYGGSGGYGGLAGTALRLRPSSLIRRGLRRLGRGGRYGGGNGLRYGVGGGLAGLLGGAGLQGMNIGYGGGGGGSGSGGYDEDIDISSNGNGGQGYYGNGRYGLQGNYGGSGSGRSWTLGGGSDVSPNEYYNLRYGYPSTSNTGLSVDGTSGGGGVGGSRRYTLSYPNDASTPTISTADETNPTQYELMFLRNQPGSPNMDIQNGSNQDSNLQLSTGTASEANRDTSNGAGYRINVSGSGGPSTIRRTSTTGADGVEEYRVVVVNKDGNGSGRSGVSLSTSGSAPGGSGPGSWSVSSSSSASSGGNGGRAGQGGFQLTTPITSTQVTIPSTSIMGSVLSSVQGGANGEQTRGLSSGNDSSSGKIIQVIPVKTSN